MAKVRPGNGAISPRPPARLEGISKHPVHTPYTMWESPHLHVPGVSAGVSKGSAWG